MQSEFALLWTFLLSLVINWLGFAAAYILQTEKFYDGVGTLTYCTVVTLSLGLAESSGQVTIRKGIVSAFVLAWALRLGSFLVYRILSSGKDRRFDKLKQSFSGFLIAWTLQAVWVWTTALAMIILNTTNRNPKLAGVDYLGWSLYGFGLIFETVADLQKLAFKNDPRNEGKFINVGLWAISRHPNYFGEFVVWWGVFVSTIRALHGWQFVAVVSPVFVMFLICFVSGLPTLEPYADKKWGSTAEYQEYKRTVHIILPLPKFIVVWCCSCCSTGRTGDPAHLPQAPKLGGIPKIGDTQGYRPPAEHL